MKFFEFFFGRDPCEINICQVHGFSLEVSAVQASARVASEGDPQVMSWVRCRAERDHSILDLWKCGMLLWRL